MYRSGYSKTIFDARLNRCYETEKGPDIGNRPMYRPRGKVLDGSSSINGLLYIRGQAGDYDHWPQLSNAGWAYDDVPPYFRKAENQENGEDAFYGVNGPLSVADLKERPSATRSLRARSSSAFRRHADQCPADWTPVWRSHAGPIIPSPRTPGRLLSS